MTDLVTVARPYAKAIFDLARESKTLSKTLSAWLRSLDLIAQSFKSEEVKNLLANPAIERQQLVEFFEKIANPSCPDEQSSSSDKDQDSVKRKSSKKNINNSDNSGVELVGHQFSISLGNFLRLLAENNRFLIVPHVYKMLQEMQKEHEALVDVHAISAFQLDESEIKILSDLLKSKLNRDINLENSVDPALIGGVYLKIGDQVFDASVKAKLEAMRLSLL